MAKRRKKRRDRGKRRKTRAFAHTEDTSGAADTSTDNILFQTDPPYTKQSLYKLKSWTDTVAGYIREAKELRMCILHNERLMDHPYQWHVTINFEAEQTPDEIKERWGKARGKLKKRGVVALCIMEVNRSNRVHFHLIVSSQISRAALEQAVEEAMPPREVINWHKCLQRIEPGETWQLAYYVTKAKKAGYEDGRPVEDYYASKRVLFKPHLGLRKHCTIGKFWVKPRAAIWQDIRAEEERIAEGLEKPGIRQLVQHVYELLGRWVPFSKIERAYGYTADSEAVKRWAEKLLAGDDGGYEAITGRP